MQGRTRQPPAPPAPPWIIGANVPWSVAWSGEQAFRLQPSRLFPGMIELDQADRPGEGQPLFAGVHVSRHRRAMAGQLCHVCGRPTPSRDRCIFPVVAGGFVTLADGQERYGGNVPPVHRACGDRAKALCPHLHQLWAEPVACPHDDEGRLIWRTDIPPGMEAIAAGLPAGVEVVMSCYRLYGPRFTERVRRLRADWERAARARREGSAPALPHP